MIGYIQVFRLISWQPVDRHGCRVLEVVMGEEQRDARADHL